jgi:hypothetical protein
VAFYVLLMALIVLLRDITALVGRISARIANPTVEFQKGVKWAA